MNCPKKLEKSLVATKSQYTQAMVKNTTVLLHVNIPGSNFSKNMSDGEWIKYRC